mgnify:CR=1 FL=1
MKVLKFVNLSSNPDPCFAKYGDSGFDIRAWVVNETNSITLKPLERKLVNTGLYFDIPENTEIQIRPRSGLSVKKGLSIVNSPATIDEGYTGEIGVVAINLSKEDILIKNGDKIAQGVLCPVFNSPLVNMESVSSIDKITERGDGGYGHTGIN